MIGTLGKIPFEVSSDKIRTFTDFKQNLQASYSEHAIHNKKGLLEFTGLKASDANLTISLNESLGLDIHDEIKAFTELLESHEPVKLILDGKSQGQDKWVLESLDITHEIINNQGRTIKATLNLKLKEYIS